MSSQNDEGKTMGRSSKNLNKIKAAQDNTPVNSSRRKALAGVVGAAGAVTVWHAPIINSVMLPAHAQSSAVTAFFGASVSATTAMNQSSPLDMIISTAYAGEAFPTDYTVSVQETAQSSGMFDIGVFESLDARGFDTAEVLYRGQVTGTGNLAIDGNPCELGIGPLAVEVGDVTDESVVLNFTDRGQTVTVPAGDGVLPVPMCVEAVQPNFSRIDVSIPGQFGLRSEQPEFSPLDILVPPAYAGDQQGPLASMTAVRQNSGDFTVTFQDQDSELRWVGDLTNDGTIGSLSFQVDCNQFSDVNARIDSVSFNELLLSVNLDGFVQFTLLPGLLPLPDICVED